MPWITETKRKKEIFNNPTNLTFNGKRYYDDKRWRLLRESYIHNHPLCELCLLEDRSVEAEHIHHKRIISYAKSYEEKEALLLDENNLMALCKNHHNELHNYERKHGLVSYNQLISLKEKEIEAYRNKYFI